MEALAVRRASARSCARADPLPLALPERPLLAAAGLPRGGPGRAGDHGRRHRDGRDDHVHGGRPRHGPDPRGASAPTSVADEEGGALLARLAQIGGPLLVRTIDDLEAGRLSRCRSPRRASRWRPRSPPRIASSTSRTARGPARAPRPGAGPGHRRHLPHRRRALQGVAGAGRLRAGAAGPLRGRGAAARCTPAPGRSRSSSSSRPAAAGMAGGRLPARLARAARVDARMSAPRRDGRRGARAQRRAARAAPRRRRRLRRPRARRRGAPGRARPARPRPGHPPRLRRGPAAAHARLAHRRRARPARPPSSPRCATSCGSVPTRSPSPTACPPTLRSTRPCVRPAALRGPKARVVGPRRAGQRGHAPPGHRRRRSRLAELDAGRGGHRRAAALDAGLDRRSA